MNPEPLPTSTDSTPSVLAHLPIAELPAEERSRVIREVVSLAMEGPLGPESLTPMPVPASATDPESPQDGTPLSPLPASRVPHPPE